MKKTLMLALLPSLIWAQSYREIIRDIDHAPAMQSAQKMEEASAHLYESARAAELPTLDVSLSGAWLNETPTATFRMPPLFQPMKAPMGTKTNYVGEVALKYPLFTGFAVTAMVDKARWQKEQAHLKVLDLKRNLYLNATALISAILATGSNIDALQKAMHAMDAAYKKANGLYKNGLLPPADLYNIRAKKAQIGASLAEVRSQKKQLLNRLSYLVDHPVQSVEIAAQSEAHPDKNGLIEEALQQREDIRALEAALMMDKADVKLAKSRFYPTVAAAAALKRQGDTLELNGNGIMNADQSYVGLEASWNLFDGMGDKHRVEAARLKELSATTALTDYKNRVKTALENAFLELDALQQKLRSAEAEVKAQEAYYKLTKGRFANKLASADELSRSIADLAAARAKAAAIHAQIFNQRAKISLMAGLDRFEKAYGAE
ncbi:MAG TPA: TolC family protein [Campylobacteraceae bacterium]|nr:TolC family protein [Campylobacteraceae bacterium]